MDLNSVLLNYNGNSELACLFRSKQGDVKWGKTVSTVRRLGSGWLGELFKTQQRSGYSLLEKKVCLPLELSRSTLLFSSQIVVTIKIPNVKRRLAVCDLDYIMRSVHFRKFVNIYNIQTIYFYSDHKYFTFKAKICYPCILNICEHCYMISSDLTSI